MVGERIERCLEWKFPYLYLVTPCVVLYLSNAIAVGRATHNRMLGMRI